MIKYFEYNDFEYYALIAAETIEQANSLYAEDVSELGDSNPDEITEAEARQKFSGGVSEGDDITFEDVTEQLPSLLLVDGELV